MTEFSWPRGRKTLSVLRTWFLVNLFMVRSAFPFRMRMERKLNTGCGIPFARSWQQPFLVVSTIYGLLLGLVCCTLVLHQGPQCLMYLTLLDQQELCMLLNFHIGVVEIL
ncbi:hypothetical protein GW17_00044233 [Ensete ventricosum]|nr:hypothetical protein GW17_00044233 [Ensete ventricosum]